MSEEHRYSEAAESDDELPWTQGAAVKVTKRPEPAVLTSQVKPRFVKLHKLRSSAKQSKQRTRRDLLMVLAKKPSPTAKVGWRGSARRMVVHSCAAVPQSCLGVAKGHLAAQMRLSRLESKLRITSKKPVTEGPKSKLNV
jgi:hypothetical protein